MTSYFANGPCEECGRGDLKTVEWTGDDADAWRHPGCGRRWCMRCVFVAQLNYAQEQADAIPGLTSKIQRIDEGTFDQAADDAEREAAWRAELKEHHANWLRERVEIPSDEVVSEEMAHSKGMVTDTETGQRWWVNAA